MKTAKLEAMRAQDLYVSSESAMYHLKLNNDIFFLFFSKKMTYDSTKVVDCQVSEQGGYRMRICEFARCLSVCDNQIEYYLNISTILGHY